MPRWMANTAGGLALLAPFVLGCNLLPGVRDVKPPPPPAAAAPGSKPTVESLVEYMNQQAGRVQNLRASVDIDAKAPNGQIGLSGRIAAQKPLQFRLMADVLGKSAVDIGSNSDEFWYWISKDDPPYLYHCAYKDLATGKVNVPFPFQPDMVLAALGIAEYDPKAKFELREQPRTWELIQASVSANGQKVTRITVFNKEIAKPGLPQVLGHVIQDASGNVVCKAVVEKVKEDRDTNTKIPSVVKIEWPAMKMSMKLMLGSIETNRIDNATAARLFTRTGLKYEPFDLARGRNTPASLQQTGAVVPRSRLNGIPISGTDTPMQSPLRFHPDLRPLVWGGRGLGESLGKRLPTEAAYGESWEVSDHDSHASVVADGPLAGKTLRDLMRHDSAGLLGSPRERFPWLVKYLDCHDWLSVQVHPDDRAVVDLWPGEGGKTEAWFILDAKPGSRVYAGLLPGVDEQAMREAVGAGRVAECLHSFEPRPGDCLFLPAGTVHAVGGGVLMAEVQQTSAATFRLFDWNRVDANGKGRELHVDKALACIDWDAGPVSPVRVPGYPGRAGDVSLVRCPYFDLDYHCLHDARALNATPSLRVFLVLHGGGHYDAGGSRQPLAVGDTVLFPAGTGPVPLVPDGALGLLAATLPG